VDGFWMDRTEVTNKQFARFVRETGYVTVVARQPDPNATSNDPTEPGVPKRVKRGASILCCDNYCMRYMAGGRRKGDVESTGNHIGFRCVRAPQ
jgi:formylglycine-generating enzyme required for sulfatase activity